ncbi:NADPH-dependent FMN reductase [Priestia endophytica]|uniref:NADPH-dependent FMN reductase n=1 Tax=Priestia endophytica TaxID=135735 RepID=UPI002E1E05B9|nr:NAD(P)H-dependent oxidoreductase [Priestia endophytica]
MGNRKKVVAISGSIRECSTNTNILENLASFFKEDIDYSIYDKVGEFPHFNPDLDDEEGPKVIEEFRQELNEADALIFCTPEYARGIPGVLKNAIDWLVSSGQLLNKTVAVITASPMVAGGEKAQASFLQTLEMLNANVVKNGTLVISSVGTKLNSNGEATDEDTRLSLELLVESIITEMKKKKAPLA